MLTAIETNKPRTIADFTKEQRNMLLHIAHRIHLLPVRELPQFQRLMLPLTLHRVNWNDTTRLICLLYSVANFDDLRVLLQAGPMPTWLPELLTQSGRYKIIGRQIVLIDGGYASTVRGV